MNFTSEVLYDIIRKCAHYYLFLESQKGGTFNCLSGFIWKSRPLVYKLYVCNKTAIQRKKGYKNDNSDKRSVPKCNIFWNALYLLKWKSYIMLNVLSIYFSHKSIFVRFWRFNSMNLKIFQV